MKEIHILKELFSKVLRVAKFHNPLLRISFYILYAVITLRNIYYEMKPDYVDVFLHYVLEGLFSLYCDSNANLFLKCVQDMKCLQVDTKNIKFYISL